MLCLELIIASPELVIFFLLSFCGNYNPSLKWLLLGYLQSQDLLHKPLNLPLCL